MALNITFDGFVYLNDSSLATDNIKYQGLFYPNGTASSATTWNDVRVTEASGYYNINLGDGDWLTQNGTALSTAVVMIVFWKGDTLDRNSLCSGVNRLEEWGVLELDLIGVDVYTNATQVKSNIVPVINWDLPLTGFVGDSYDAINSSYDNHSWLFGGVEMQHIRTKYGEDIQLINTITDSSYDWDDGSVDLNLPGVSDASHIWTTAGSYDVQLVIIDECTGWTPDVKSILISNKAPIPYITCLQAVGNDILTPDTPVSFQYSGTDLNNQITSIEWTINDSGAYGTTTTISIAGRDDIVPHADGLGTSWCSHSSSTGAFTNPGTHTVSIIIHWNDGFNDLTINYSEDFNQELFTAPIPDFTQNPPQATLSSTVNFTNSSSNVGRVGTGLPECERYDWEFTDGGEVQSTVSDVDYAYVYSISPMSVSSYVELCTNWNDGWDNHITCTNKDVVFETKLIVTPEDCYYNLDIIGTSSDGSISGYSWEIYRDTTISGGTGPWEKIWESPVGIEQKIKQVGFTEIGHFRVVGYVHGGGTTSDDEILYIHEVCPSSSYHVIWDGTGVNDNGSDWQRTGFGVEATYAAHAGTNGLDASSMAPGLDITFGKQLSSVDVNDYESINMWIKLLHIEDAYGLNINLHKIGFFQGETLKLSNYVNTDRLNKWQKVFINIDDFNLSPLPIPGHPTYVNRLKLTSTGNISFYLDDVIFSSSKLERVAVSVCSVDISSREEGGHRISGTSMVPSLRGKFDTETSIRKVNTFPKPKLN